MLTLHQLEVFIAVAEEMSVGRASERLHVSQPAVSSSIASLERVLGVKVITKNGRGIDLTPAGKELLRYAPLVLGLVDEALQASRAADALRRRAVRVGSTSSLVGQVLAPVMAAIKDRQPEIEFTLDVDNRASVWKQLASHEIDVALSSQPPSIDPFASVATMPNEFILVSRPGAVFPGTLERATWLVREEGSTTRAANDEVLARLALHPPLMVINSDEAIRTAIEAGLGIGLLPASSVVESLRRRSLVTVRTAATPLSQPWHLVVRSDEVLEPAVRQFVTEVVASDPRFEWTTYGLDSLR